MCDCMSLGSKRNGNDGFYCFVPLPQNVQYNDVIINNLTVTGSATIIGPFVLSQFNTVQTNSTQGLYIQGSSSNTPFTIPTNLSNTIYGIDTPLGLTTATRNIIYGAGAAQTLTTGNDNSIFGQNAGSTITSGSANTILGSQAGQTIVSNSNNTVIGYGANASNTVTYGTALGSGTIVTSSNTIQLGRSGTDNVVCGNALRVPGLANLMGGFYSDALSTLYSQNLINVSLPASSTNFTINNYAGVLTGTESLTSIGVSSGNAATAGTFSGNVFIGYESGLTTTGINDTYIGYKAGAAGTTGGQNTVVGFGAGTSFTTASQASIFGYQAGKVSTVTIDAFGYNCAVANTTGASNVAIGNSAFSSNTTGNYNVVVGYQAMNVGTTNGSNVVIGYQAGQNSQASDSVIIGYQAMNVPGSGSGGFYCVAIGYKALYSNTGIKKR